MPDSRTPLGPPQQERSRETRRRIVTAAERLWGEKGFDETSVSEICAAARISKGAFYRHFLRKEDLFVELATRTGERSGDDARAAIDDGATTEEALRAVVRGVGRRSATTPRPILARTVSELLGATERWSERRTPRGDMRSTLEELVRRGIDRSEIEPDTDPAETASMIIVIVLQAMREWSIEGWKVELDELLWRRTRQLLVGLAPR